MLDMLEKLITEHGSSAILRERLELFSDKYSALEKQITQLHEKNKVLEYQFDKAKHYLFKPHIQIKKNDSEINKSHMALADVGGFVHLMFCANIYIYIYI